MKMLHAENALASYGSTETRSTGVAGEAKIVYAILTGMVTDKIEYCLREPGTNAWEANRKRPFELTLPSRFLNIVRFRDFGKGLSHQFMMRSYAKIGKSTKDDSDDAVGGWGFGSKSPLAYLMRQDGAGAYDVISRHQGMRRVYNIGINPAGQIQISFLGEAPMDDTDRGTGLEVSFPVRPEDVDRFKEYAERIFWGFSPAPIVLPEQGMKIGSGHRLLKTATWSTWESRTDNELPWTGPHVRLGPVLYPVRLNQLDGLSGFVRTTDNLLLEAPIGSLSVSASREQLSYDDRTKDTLVQLLKTYETDLFAKSNAEMEKCETYFEACALAHRLSGTFGYDRAGIVRSKLSWRGYAVLDSVFNDTTPSALYRAFRCSGIPDKFRANSYAPQGLAGRQIVVEHSAYRSVERLEALGFDKDSALLWVRVTKPYLNLFLNAFGLTEDDVIIMDKVKLPKRVVDPNAPDSVKTKIRTRRQLDWDGHNVTEPVDLLAGGFYVYQPKTNRYDTKRLDLNPWCHHNERGTFLTPNGEKLPHFFDKLKKAGVITEELAERPILYLSKEEELPDGWEPLGPALKAQVEEMLDVTQLTPRITWNADSFHDHLNALDKFDLGLCPPVLVDLVYRRRALLSRIATPGGQVLNDHDRLADVLKTIVTDVKIPTAADPSLAINDEFNKATSHYRLFDYVMSKNRLEYGRHPVTGQYGYDIVTAENQRVMDEYFRLVTAI